MSTRRRQSGSTNRTGWENSWKSQFFFVKFAASSQALQCRSVKLPGVSEAEALSWTSLQSNAGWQKIRRRIFCPFSFRSGFISVQCRNQQTSPLCLAVAVRTRQWQDMSTPE